MTPLPTNVGMRDRLDLGYILQHNFSENIRPMSRGICFVSPSIHVKSDDENILKHAEPGVAFSGMLPKLLNFLNCILYLILKKDFAILLMLALINMHILAFYIVDYAAYSFFFHWGNSCKSLFLMVS